MIDEYLTDNLSWQTHATGGAGRPVYDAPVIIKGRKHDRIRLVRDKTGAQVVSSAEGWTKSAIQIDDKIDGRIVLARGDQKTLDGILECYMFYLA